MFNRWVLLVLSLLFPVAAAGQQAYPTKPIRVVVPFGPGGGVDNFARPLAQKLTDQLGQQVIVDNRPGASSLIGGALVAGAAPDGYTLLCTFDSPLFIAPLITKNPPYHPLRDFTPIISAATTPIVIVTHPSLQVASIKDLIAYARKSATEVHYVTAGSGTSQHLTGEYLAVATGTKLAHIAYKGGAAAMGDLVGGHVKVGILVLSTVLPHIQAGRLRGIAVTGGRRSKSYPELPTIAESGVPGFAMPEVSLAMLGPARLPEALVKRLNAEVQKAMGAPEVRTALERIGYEPRPGSAEEFRAQGVKTYAMYQRMVKETSLSTQK
jgi:tripartite-type tricarboxylate transporter receptor subunit TctC